MKVHPAIIEKDFWICYVLQYLFNKSKYSRFYTFKGGTSLSKSYNVISRMSEDIDLIIDWRILGIDKNEPLLERSKTKQESYNNKINERAQNFISNEMYLDLLNGLSNINEIQLEVIKQEQLINIYYPKTYDNFNVNILPFVRLEIGPLAAWSPAIETNIKPYISDVFPNIGITPAIVRTVSITRTFWEKITILHQEAHRPEYSTLPKRY